MMPFSSLSILTPTTIWSKKIPIPVALFGLLRIII
jgi:hypothetical protein